MAVQNGSDGEVTVSFHGNVAVLTMDRGENRFNPSFLDAMQNALDKVESNPDAKVLVTRGKGKFYSNGLDLNFLKYMKEKDETGDFGREFQARLFRLMARLIEFPLVTVAALNGHAFAGGGFLALAHDYRVMNTEKGWFCLNEVHIGMNITPYFQELARLRMTPQVFADCMVLGKRYTANEAKDAGIVQAICPEKDLIETAAKVGRSIIPKNGFNRKYLHNSKLNVFGLAIRPLKDKHALVKSLL